MNVALISAGGIGERSKLDVPKQFLSVNDKPLIIYTLKAFQESPYIDAIAVICLNGWEDTLQAYANKEGINKCKWVFKGGPNVQESWYNGIMGLVTVIEDFKTCNVICHDGVRPLVSQRIIEDCVRKCDEHGFAITVNHTPEVIMKLDGLKHALSNVDIDRKMLFVRQNPQAFKLFDLYYAYTHKQYEKMIDPYETVCNGEIPEVNIVFSDIFNFKITYPEDIKLFKKLVCSTD